MSLFAGGDLSLSVLFKTQILLGEFQMDTKSAEPKVKNGLLPTPPMAKGLPKSQLTDNRC
jgi:hypothetical protein